MRAPISSVLLVMACTTAGYLWWELHAERHATVHVEQGALREHEPASGVLSQGIATKSPQVLDLFSADRRTSGNAKVELLKDPEYRKARLAQIRANQVRRYPGLAEALGLSEREADQLFDLLAEQQLNTNAELNGITAKGLDRGAEREERTRIQEEDGRKRDELLQGFLGSARFEQWQTYQESLPSRAEAGQMLESVLTAGGQSIDGAQLEPVVTAAAIEQARYEKEVQQLLQENRATGPHPLAQAQEKMLSLREESNRRILDAAAAHLSPEQLAALSRNFEQQATAARDRLNSYQQRTTP